MSSVQPRIDPRLCPITPFGPVDRLRVLARLLPNVHLAEVDIDVGFDEAWGFLSDIERSVPQFDQEVTRLTISRRLGPGQRDGPDRLSVRAVTRRVPIPFRVDVEPGLIWMQTRPVRAYVVGMAAEPLGDGRSHYAQLEGPSRSVGQLGRLGRLARHHLVRHVEADVAAVARLLSPGRGR